AGLGELQEGVGLGLKLFLRGGREESRRDALGARNLRAEGLHLVRLVLLLERLKLLGRLLQVGLRGVGGVRLGLEVVVVWVLLPFPGQSLLDDPVDVGLAEQLAVVLFGVLLVLLAFVRLDLGALLGHAGLRFRVVSVRLAGRGRSRWLTVTRIVQPRPIRQQPAAAGWPAWPAGSP